MYEQDVFFIATTVASASLVVGEKGVIKRYCAEQQVSARRRDSGRERITRTSQYVYDTT